MTRPSVVIVVGVAQAYTVINYLIMCLEFTVYRDAIHDHKTANNTDLVTQIRHDFMQFGG